ncbi:MAG: InlB B-repeat-containing protein, partial [Bacilli bacterium]|nr:InlB B-repeat-containing protein [Bacilli bacterium]
MKKRLYVGIVILLLVLTVGFAAVSTNLIISSYASVSFNAADYQVLFTKALASTGNYVSLSDDAQTILYNPNDLNEVNDESVIDYKITNNSSLYDINVTIKVKLLDGNNEEVSPEGIYNIEETIVPEGTIEARSSKDGQLTITLLTGTLMDNYHFVIEYEVTKLGRTVTADGERIEPGITVTFDANGGQMIGATDKKVMIDTYYGELPETTKLNEAFEGWYTDPIGGEKITSASVVTIPSNHTLYAHYQDPVATYNNYGYSTLQKAVNQVPIRNTELVGDKDTVELLKDTNESVIISEGKDMIINLNNHNVSTTGLTDEYVVINYGSLVMNDGNIIGSASAIHNYGNYEANDINQTSTAEGLVIDNTGEATIEGGVYHSSNNTVSNSGKVTINESEHIDDGTDPVIYMARGSQGTINGGTFTSDTARCISVSGNVTINGGNFSSSIKDTLYSSPYSDVTINGGTFNNSAADQSVISVYGILKANGGTFISTNHYSFNVANGGNLTLDGATITPGDNAKAMLYNAGITRINDGTFTGGSTKSYPFYNATTGTLTVAGGSYSTNVSVFMNTGTMIVEDTTKIENSTKALFLSNGSTAVTTIEGGTYSTTGAVIFNPQNNSKMIVKGGVYNSSSNIANSNGGNLIIDGGTFTATGSSYPEIVQQSSGSTVINDGTFTSQSYAVWAKGNTTINGGYIQSSASYPLYVQANATANITGGTLYSPENASAVASVSGTLNISGGTYINETPDTVTIVVNATGILNVEDGTDVEEYKSNFISNYGITNINGGKLITNKQMPLLVQQSTGTMNINGGEIEAYKTHCLLVKGSTVNITGGTLKNKYGTTISINAGANVNITGGTITNDTLNDENVSNNSDSQGDTIYSSGTLVLSGGEVKNYSTLPGIYIAADSSTIVKDDAILSSSSGVLLSNFGTVEITGGTLKGESNASYLLDNGGTATISGGSIQQLSSSHAISNASKGILYIEDGANLSVSNSSLLNNIGQTTINGGTLTSTGPILIRNQSRSKLDITGGSLSSSGDNVINGSGTINITGGSLSISGPNGPA